MSQPELGPEGVQIVGFGHGYHGRWSFIAKKSATGKQASQVKWNRRNGNSTLRLKVNYIGEYAFWVRSPVNIPYVRRNSAARSQELKSLDDDEDAEEKDEGGGRARGHHHRPGLPANSVFP